MTGRDSAFLSVYLGTLILLSGCIAGPISGQGSSVPIAVNNSVNTTQSYTFEVSVVEYPANISVQRSDGLDSTGRISPGLAVSEPGDDRYYTAVEFPNSSRLHSRYTLSPGEGKQTEIEGFSADSAVIVVIYRSESEIVSYVTANCDGDLAFLEVTMFHYGAGASYDCTGGWG
ncbi:MULTISPECIES: hypothetical protein [Haloarcula]|uniref:Lipoprotein n=1 Tax=Haloarcula pellucida TaxID=1427151 RepID=A0A830GN67_9EURY|nr:MULTISPECIES: hypothetical protein [Halomicroarcula]MBX0347921.1 hypothetical protein [Halomicroarcula pellucida]MDS0279950.1 hypothetical protein [Halomicroarcula sp. S1AR25-4]GGN96064.1 hypothetical protein GCM10009030_23920 [Halomicroarcula pellucida]